jgi:hypothetical protein
MKHAILISWVLLCLAAIPGRAQERQRQDTTWARIDTLEKQGLYRSAWDVVNHLYTTAVHQGDKQTEIKALIYQLKYRQRLDEGSEEANLRQVDSLLQKATGVPRAILQSMLAEMYLRYAQANRYRLLERLPLAGAQSADVSTWALQDLYRRITSLYEASLSDAERLKKIPLAQLQVIVDTGKNTLSTQPTLFDLLAHRALSYYQEDPQAALAPAARFLIDQPIALADADQFVHWQPEGNDTTTLALKAIRLYQELIQWHSSDSDPSARTAADLDRLQYMYAHAILPGKDTLYRDALTALHRKALPKAIADEVAYQLAQWYWSEGSQYDAYQHPEHRDYLKKALDICQASASGSLTPGSLHCKQLQASILQADVSLTLEQVNLPQKPFRALVRYRNTPSVWFRIIKLSGDPHEVFAQNTKSLAAAGGQHPLRSWKQEFPHTEDYQNHRTEMKIDGLPSGRYLLVASGDPTFSAARYPVVSLVFYVSAISYVYNGRGEYLVLDRETGKPLAGARVHLWESRYNAQKRQSELQDAGQYTADRDGYFRADTGKNEPARMPEIFFAGDHLFTGQAQYVPYVSSGQPDEDTLLHKTFLFTDRSIYRPGQTVYFKGINLAVEPHTHDSHALEGKNSRVLLIDANGQVVDSASFTSNAFGSYAGSFVLPAGRLNGNMHLEASPDEASVYFSVEQYKRPAFYVDWDTTKTGYALGDTVDLQGTVTAYTQAHVQGATVRYRVERRTRTVFPMPWLKTRMIYPPQQAVTVAQGSTRTDTGGHFTVRFPAWPDPEAPRAMNPLFTFTVSADVTDITGEAHHFSYALPMGYSRLQLDLDLPEKISVADLDTIRLTSSDLSGNFVPARVTVRLFPLQDPHRLIRTRYWERPDEFLMQETAYHQAFPYDEYDDEADPSTWSRKNFVISGVDSTTAKGVLALSATRIPGGWYAVEASAKDTRGDSVKITRYVEVYNPTETSAPFHDPLWVANTHRTTLPGEELSWRVVSTAGAHLIRQDERVDHWEAPHGVPMRGFWSPQTMAIKAADRGGVIAHYLTVLHNRLYTAEMSVEVPWKEKQLSLQMESFRDKLQPGHEETWTLKITGPDGEKVSTELLASMYDASLDAFRPHSWPTLDVYPTLQSRIDWQGGPQFSDVASQVTRAPKPETWPDIETVYPSLRWFGYPFTPYHRILRFDAVGGAVAPAPANARMDKESISAQASQAADTAASPALREVPVRENLKETAFFLPQLHSDDSGRIAFTFQVPEALTQWKLMLFGHSRQMQYGYGERTAVTQKSLMIQPAAPRFLRQGDRVELSAKITNLSPEDIQGSTRLTLSDPVTGASLDSLFGNRTATQAFSSRAGQPLVVHWTLTVPDHYTGPLTYKMVAAGGSYQDGEQNVLPVLTNRTLVTETLPLYVRGNGTQTLQWDALSQSGTMAGSKPLGLTIEFSSNPVWYAIQALPWLDADKAESTDALFNGYYVNALSGFLADRIPRFRQTMTQWLTRDSDALKSPLQQNETLKTVLLEETPWIQAAQDESAQKAETASWFEHREGSRRLGDLLDKLVAAQLSNGGFTWFEGMEDDPFMTAVIMTGIGHLRQLGAWPAADSASLYALSRKAIAYLDNRMADTYRGFRQKNSTDSILTPASIQYLYLRSFFPDIPPADSLLPMLAYYRGMAARQWQEKPVYLQAMIALVLNRSGNRNTAWAVMKALKQKAITDPVHGMHWKAGPGNYLWYQAPLEAQAACIEAFREITRDQETINALCVWLLGQKQGIHWPTRRSTADAVYALILGGGSWAETSPALDLQLGHKKFTFNTHNTQTATGYRKIYLPGDEIQADMGHIKLRSTQAAADQPGWGALYYQYLAPIDQLETQSHSPVQISRQVSLEKATAAGSTLVAVNAGTALHVGDKLQIRLVLRIGQAMDYVHLKDVRASCMEPLQTLSGYRWEQGAGYYATTTDVAMHFYFSHLNPGTYVLTYPVYVVQSGDYAGGVSTAESLYAPSFHAHSAGGRITVSQK